MKDNSCVSSSPTINRNRGSPATLPLRQLLAFLKRPVLGFDFTRLFCYRRKMIGPCKSSFSLCQIACLVLLTIALGLSVTGCAIHQAPPVLPEQYTLDKGQLKIHSDFELEPSHRLLNELTVQRRELANLLGIEPTDERIHIFLFGNDEDYRQYMQNLHPDFPARRALFVQTDTQLKIYASWHERVAEDLRHEVTHGYLHSVIPEIPLWLDEGLAEFFETGRQAQGLHSEHVHLLKTLLQQGSWTPNLARLEALGDAETMAKIDYAESWLWVHFLLFNESFREQHLIQRNLIQLRKHGSAFQLAKAVDARVENVESALIGHLEQLSRR